MTSRSRSRGRSRSRSHSPVVYRRPSSPAQYNSRSPRGSRPRSADRSVRPKSYSVSRSRSPHIPVHRNGNGERGRSTSRTRSQSPSHDGRRSYRDRTHSRNPSREARRPQSSKVVVEKLTKNVTEAHLQEIFGPYGRIQSIDLPMNRQFMTNRGTAYIVYETAAESESAIAHMHEAQLDGSVITVSIVLPRRAFSRSPPPIKNTRPPYLPPRHSAPRAPLAIQHRSPPPRRGGYGGRPRDWDDPQRNNGARQYTRSPSPPRRRERSYSGSRSLSRTPPRRRAPPARSPPRRRRRSPSYSSYSSYSKSRSRSRSRSPSRTRYNTSRR